MTPHPASPEELLTEWRDAREAIFGTDTAKTNAKPLFDRLSNAEYSLMAYARSLRLAASSARAAVPVFDNDTTDWRKIAPELDYLYSRLCDRAGATLVDEIMEYIARAFREHAAPSGAVPGNVDAAAKYLCETVDHKAWHGKCSDGRAKDSGHEPWHGSDYSYAVNGNARQEDYRDVVREIVRLAAPFGAVPVEEIALIDDSELMRLMRKHLPEKAVVELTITKWKDGIDIDYPYFVVREFMKAILTALGGTRATKSENKPERKWTGPGYLEQTGYIDSATVTKSDGSTEGRAGPKLGTSEGQAKASPHAGPVETPESASGRAEKRQQAGIKPGPSEPCSACGDSGYPCPYCSPSAPAPATVGETKLTRDDLLVLLIEECGEVIQAATKCLRFGYEADHGIGYGKNDVVLSREYGDVQAIMDALPLDMPAKTLSQTAKIAKAEAAKARFSIERRG